MRSYFFLYDLEILFLPLRGEICRNGEKFTEMGGGQIRAASADFGIRVSGTRGNWI